MGNRLSKATCVSLFLLVFIWAGNARSQSYRVETIKMPDGLTNENGAIEFLPDGRLVGCFTRGEVMIYNPKDEKWSLFAEGFHDPLGILVISNSEMLIIQRPELTRVKDTDGDGSADLYEKVTDDFGLSGNYHEYNYGPVKDGAGNLFIALNSTSPGGGMRPEVRGKIDTLGRDGSNGLRQMYSAVPYRGWIMKLTADGQLHPYASGFRSPNGLGFDSEGNLFATDNQGDWVGTSPLFHVQEGKFYGHPGSLIWTRGWNKGNPYRLSPEVLNGMRTKPAVLFPHGIMANSPTQPLCDQTNGQFGPFGGQLLIGEMNKERIVRVMLERVGGELQGACIPFLDGAGLRKGNNRLAFSPDGVLYVGQNSHGWLGDEGIQRIVFTGKTPVDIYTMNLTETGFKLVFTQPMEKESLINADNFKLRHYNYAYHKKYGSDQMGVQSDQVRGIEISADGKEVTFIVEALQEGYVYELNLNNIKSKDGGALENTLICYTLNKLIK
jgi:hypothetical protein